MTLPIRHVHTLSLENCNKLSSQSLFVILQSASGVRFLNIRGCDGVDDQLFKDLNPSVHLKNLEGIRFGSHITYFGVRHLVKKFSNLTKVEIFGANLTTELVLALFRLEKLEELNISYTQSHNLDFGLICKSNVLKVANIFPVRNFSINPHTLNLFDALSKCPIETISTNLAPTLLTRLFPY